MKSVKLILMCVLVLAGLNVNAGQIHQAVSAGDIEKTKSLLKADPELVKELGEQGESPLFLAIVMGNYEIAELLIQNGADVNQGCPAFSFMAIKPIHGAVMSGDIKTAGLLLDKGADIEAEIENYGVTPLFIAISNGETYHFSNSKNEEMEKFLISRGAKVTRLIKSLNVASEKKEKLCKAVMAGEVDKVQTMIDEKPEIVDVQCAKGTNLLFTVACSGNVEMAKVLLKNGVDVDAMSMEDHLLNGTPLFAAVMSSKQSTDKVDRHEMIKFLVENGADVNIKEGYFDSTPLDLAITLKNTEAEKYLKKHGAISSKKQ
jgi:ankyrin repeat protein